MFEFGGYASALGLVNGIQPKECALAGSEEGGANWAIIASLIETAKLNGINPQAWLADTLSKLVNRWPMSRIDDLMPWAYAKIATGTVKV